MHLSKAKCLVLKYWWKIAFVVSWCVWTNESVMQTDSNGKESIIEHNLYNIKIQTRDSVVHTANVLYVINVSCHKKKITFLYQGEKILLFSYSLFLKRYFHCPLSFGPHIQLVISQIQLVRLLATVLLISKIFLI